MMSLGRLRCMLPALAVGAIAAVFLAPRSASAIEIGCITGRVVVEGTGAPAEGVQCATYHWDSVTGQWCLDSWGEVAADGSFEIPTTEPREVVVYFSGGYLFIDEMYRDVAVSSPLEVPRNTGFPLNVEGYSRLGAGTRVEAPAAGECDLGTVAMTARARPYGTIVGRVTEEFSGRGTAWAGVWAYRLDESDGTWKQAAFVQPLENGTYTLAGTAQRPLVGKVRLKFEVIGKSTTWYSNGTTIDSARTINVAPGATVYGVDQVISIPGQMRGALLWASDLAPERNATVEIYGVDIDYPEHDFTDRSGIYVFGRHIGMPAGTYRIVAPHVIGYDFPTTWYGQASTEAKARKVVMPEGGLIDRLDIFLSHEPAMAGSVIDPSGRAVPDILVKAYKLDGSGAWRATASRYTNTEGRYSFVFGSGGTYTLSFTDRCGTGAGGDDEVYYLGGASSLSSSKRISVPAGAAAFVPITVISPADARTTRLWGDDRYETAIAASSAAFPDGEATCAVLATGEAFPDALSGAGLAGAVDGPILLTRPKSLYPGLLDEFDRLGVRKLYVLGGEPAISQRQQGLLVALGYEVERVGGRDRWATAAAIAREIDQVSGVDELTPVFVASGANYADALSAGPAAFATRGVVLLVAPKSVPSATSGVVQSLGLRTGYVVGGPPAVSDATLRGLRTAGLSASRCAAGANRYDTAALFATFAERRGWLGGPELGLAVGTGFADALSAGPATGRARGAVLLSQPSKLPASTAQAISARRSRTDSIKVYGGPRAIESGALIQAGSR